MSFAGGRRPVAVGTSVESVTQPPEELTQLQKVRARHEGQAVGHVGSVCRQHFVGQSAALVGQRHADDAPVPRVGTALNEALYLQSSDDTCEVSGGHEQQSAELDK